MKRISNYTSLLCLSLGLLYALPVAAASKRTKPPVNDPAETITIEVTGGFQESQEKARRDAIQVAQEQIKDHLRTMEKPIQRTPAFDYINDRMVKGVTFTEQDLGTVSKERFYRATVKIEMNSTDLKTLRSRDRSANLALVLLGSSLLIGIAALFFKVDAYTGGHITRWLIPGSVGIAIIVTVIWWWAY